MPFHEIGDDDWQAMCDADVTWRDIADCFAQPPWCKLADALDPMGCWSLTGRLVRTVDDCEECEFCIPRKQPLRVVPA